MTNHLSQMEKYYFDNLYQLTRVDYGNGDVHQWSYDDIGNRVQQVVIPSGQPPVVTNYTYYQNGQSRNSQLLQSDGLSTYTWDNNGNLSAKAATQYAWDYDDRLVGISGPSTSASYVYDFQGNRIKKTVSGVETAYLYLAEDIVKETTGGITTNYLHGIGIDEPVMMDRASAKSYYFSDGLGSIRELTDAVGTVQNSYTYGTWGELRAQNITVPNSYGYTGREFAEEGLYFYRARYLDPAIGMFILEDPIGFNKIMNFYRYVGNNPIIFIDPLGLNGCKPEEEPGRDYLVGRPWTEERWEGFWEANFLCSIFRAAMIYYRLHEIPPIKPYPDFCKFKINIYYYAKFQGSVDIYYVCRDKCGEELSREFLGNSKTDKITTYLMDIETKEAYAPDYFWWQAIGK